jgi:hypothetical protein
MKINTRLIIQSALIAAIHAALTLLPTGAAPFTVHFPEQAASKHARGMNDSTPKTFRR